MFRICQKLKKEDLFNESKILERESKCFVIEVFISIIFFILAMTTYCLTDNAMEHYHLKTLQQIFVDRYTVVNEINYNFQFLEMKSVLDFWEFMKTTFLDGLHGHPNSTIALQNERFVAFENLLLGYPRIRQVRVRKNEGCSINKMFTKHFHQCYNRYSTGIENTTHEYKGTKYQTAEETNNFMTFGEIASYNGGGYIQNLHYSRAKNLEIIENLKKIEWIDRATRLVAVELALYNANMDLYSEIKMAIEILPTGGIFPFHNMKVFHILRFSIANDMALLVVKILFYLVTLVITFDLFLNLFLVEMRNRMFKSVWTYLDLVIITLAISSGALSIYLPMALRSYIKDNDDKGNLYFGLDKLSLCHFLYSNFQAALIFLIWIKAFKYIGFNKTMLQFTTTLSKDCIQSTRKTFSRLVVLVFTYPFLRRRNIKAKAIHSFSRNNFALTKNVRCVFDTVQSTRKPTAIILYQPQPFNVISNKVFFTELEKSKCIFPPIFGSCFRNPINCEIQTTETILHVRFHC
ncbi:PKD2 family protein [Megaselia abdita]